MPDLQTELSKVINNWNQPEQTMEQQTAPTHVGKKVFDLVQAYPGLTLEEYEQLSSAIGVSAASVKNYIGMFSKSAWGLAKCEDNRYTVCSDTYKTKNEMMGIPRGQRVSKYKRRKILKARGQVAPMAQTRQPQVGRGVLMDLLVGQVKIRPGISRGHLVTFAIKHGMKTDSAKVTIRTLLKDGRLVEKDDAGLYLPGVFMVDPMEAVETVETVEVQEQMTSKATDALAKEVEVVKAINQRAIDVEALTIREARALFDQLKKYFSF